MDANRSKDGHIVVDKRFPNGIKFLAGYMHSLGLKFGLYSSAGNVTCAERAGSLGYEEKDAQDYADWGVDYLKYDNCGTQGIPAPERYRVMRDALNKTGRPIFYSICNWGQENTPSWAPELGNSWRTDDDIMTKWFNVRKLFDLNYMAQAASGPGRGWNDPDMLEVGNVNDKNGLLTLD
jgi:alpha-galactosidase